MFFFGNFSKIPQGYHNLKKKHLRDYCHSECQCWRVPSRCGNVRAWVRFRLLFNFGNSGIRAGCWMSQKGPCAWLFFLGHFDTNSEQNAMCACPGPRTRSSVHGAPTLGGSKSPMMPSLVSACGFPVGSDIFLKLTNQVGLSNGAVRFGSFGGIYGERGRALQASASSSPDLLGEGTCLCTLPQEPLYQTSLISWTVFPPSKNSWLLPLGPSIFVFSPLLFGLVCCRCCCCCWFFFGFLFFHLENIFFKIFNLPVNKISPNPRSIF